MTPTIKDFREDPERVAALRKALENPVLVEAMQVLAAKGPGVIRSDISETFASIRLGHTAGWAEYPEYLQYLATHPTDQSDFDNERLREEEEE